MKAYIALLEILHHASSCIQTKGRAAWQYKSMYTFCVCHRI